MPTELLTIGPVHVLEADVVYALPARKVFVFSTEAVTISNEIAGSFVALTGANTVGAPTSAAFIKAAAETEVTLKAD